MSVKRFISIVEGDGQFGYDLDPKSMTPEDISGLSREERQKLAAEATFPRKFGVAFLYMGRLVKRETTAQSAPLALAQAVAAEYGGLKHARDRVLGVHIAKAKENPQTSVTDLHFAVNVTSAVRPEGYDPLHPNRSLLKKATGRRLAKLPQHKL